ncbi:MAG: aromatic ring-hydroxylating dioxygenase subunit alpha [Arenicellales bacterium]
MNFQAQVIPSKISADELRAVDQPIEQARGMPNAAYIDRELFEFEREHVFASNWSAIGFIDQLEEASVKPVDFMGLPILISKTKQGEVKVFHNVCSHRGMKLVQEQKKTNGLVVCPYHSWTYSLKGELKATPHIGGVGVHQADGFQCADHGLKEIRCHIWLGIIFVNLDRQAAEFEQDAKGVIERYRKLMGNSGEPSIRAAATDAGLTMDLECNWKLAVENYLEAYHLPFIHPSLNSYSPLTEHRNEIFGEKCSGQITSTFDPKLDSDNPLPLFPDWDKSRLETGEYPAVYPNLLLGFQANHLFAMIIHPLSPTKCREELMIFYVGDEANSDRFTETRRANLQAWAQVFNEDIGPCERMQIGRNSPGYHGGAFSPVHDTCSHHFHKWIARQYTQYYAGISAS